MARRCGRQLWMAVLVLAAGIGVASGAAVAASADSTPAADSRGVATLTSTATDVAVVPARTEASGGSGSAAREAPGRSVLPLAAALVALAGGLVGRRAWRSLLPVAGCHPLVARRHAIALRAPPYPQFA